MKNTASSIGVSTASVLALLLSTPSALAVICATSEGTMECLNGGECHAAHDDWISEVDEALCDCRAAQDFIFIEDKNETELVQFVGKTCQIPVIEYCAGKKDLFCVNGGACRQASPDFNDVPCLCPEGYTGRHCEYKDADVQKSCNLDCNLNGVCQHGINPASTTQNGPNHVLPMENDGTEKFMHCVCNDGFAGLNCDVAAQKCDGPGRFCFHGAICVGEGDAQGCDCGDIPVAGDMCEYRVTNTCDNPASPENSTALDIADAMATKAEAFCVNDAICLLDDTMYYCDCDGTGHDGKHCEFLLPEEVVPFPADTPTASPTVKYTDTWSPTVEGSVTDQPTGAPSSGTTISASEPDEDLFTDGIDFGSSDEGISDDEEITAGVKFAISLGAIIGVGMVGIVILLFRRRKKMVNQAVFQETQNQEFV